MFSSPKKQLDHELKIKLNSKKFYQADSVKYLGIYFDKYLTWKHQINNVPKRLNKVNTIVFKMRDYDIILVSAQNSSSVKRLHILQKKSLKLIFFSK